MNSLIVASTASGHEFSIQQGFVYDAYGRLQTIKQGPLDTGDLVATYGYLAANGLLSTVAMPEAENATALTLSRSYDALGRLQTITNTPFASAAQSFTYRHDLAGRRDKVTLADGSYWLYG